MSTIIEETARQMVEDLRQGDTDKVETLLTGLLRNDETTPTRPPLPDTLRHSVLLLPHPQGTLGDLLAKDDGYHAFVVRETSPRRVVPSDYGRHLQDGQMFSQTLPPVSVRQLDEDYEGTVLHAILATCPPANACPVIRKLVQFCGPLIYGVEDCLGVSVMEAAMIMCRLHAYSPEMLDVFRWMLRHATSNVSAYNDYPVRKLMFLTLKKAFYFNVGLEAVRLLVYEAGRFVDMGRVDHLDAIDRASPNLVRFLRARCVHFVSFEPYSLNAAHLVAMQSACARTEAEFERCLAVLDVLMPTGFGDALCHLHEDPAWNGNVLHFALKPFADRPGDHSPRMRRLLQHVLDNYDSSRDFQRLNCQGHCPFCMLSQEQKRLVAPLYRQFKAKAELRSPKRLCAGCDKAMG